MTWNQYIEKGTSAVRRGDHCAAEKYLKKALHHAKENFARSDSRLALNLSLLGHVYFKSGDFSKAEKLLEQSLKLHVECDHLNDPCLVMDLFTLAEIKQAEGKNGEAWRLYEDTLSKIKKARPFEADIIDQATELFRKMAEQIKPDTTCGAEPDRQSSPAPPTPTPTPSKPKESVREGLPLPAMEYAEPADANEIWQQQFQTGLASMKMDDAEIEELITAYLNFESAYRLALSMFAKDDMRLIATINALADASTRLWMFDQAEALYRQAIERSQANGASVTAVNSVRLALSFLYVEAGRFELAQTIIDMENIDLPREAEPLRKRLTNAQQLLKAFTQSQNLVKQAEAAEQLEDLDRAAKLVNNALSALKQAFPPQHPEHARLLRYRSALLAKLGNIEQAEELEKRAERIEKTHAAQVGDWVRRTAELPRVELDPVPA